MTKNILHEIRHKSKYFCDQIFIFTVFCVREKKKKKVQMTVSPFWVIAGRREVSFLYHCLLMVGCPLRELLQTFSSRDCHVASEGHNLGIFFKS